MFWAVFPSTTADCGIPIRSVIGDASVATFSAREPANNETIARVLRRKWEEGIERGITVVNERRKPELAAWKNKWPLQRLYNSQEERCLHLATIKCHMGVQPMRVGPQRSAGSIVRSRKQNRPPPSRPRRTWRQLMGGKRRSASVLGAQSGALTIVQRDLDQSC